MRWGSYPAVWLIGPHSFQHLSGTPLAGPPDKPLFYFGRNKSNKNVG